jgi:hypothetical protein
MGIGTRILNFPQIRKVKFQCLIRIYIYVFTQPFFLWNGKVHRCPTIQFCFSVLGKRNKTYFLHILVTQIDFADLLILH